MEGRDSETDGPRPARGVRARRAARRGRSSSWLFWITVLLTVVAFVQAVLLFPKLLPEGPAGSAFAPEQNLPDRELTVFAADGVILKTPLDEPEADALDAEDLDARLFPGGERHRYFLLCLKAPKKQDAVFPIAVPPLRFEGKDGESWRPTDLRAAVARRGAGLPPWLRLNVKSLLPPDGSVTVPAGRSARLLLAMPEDADPARVVRVLFGDRILEPVRIKKDELDARLEDGAVLKAEAGE